MSEWCLSNLDRFYYCSNVQPAVLAFLWADQHGEEGEEDKIENENKIEEDEIYKGLKCLGQTVGMCCAPLLALCCVAQVCICGPILSCGSKILDLCCCRRTSEEEDETEMTQE